MIIAVGFAAQVLFFSRTLVQWFFSERAGKVVSPILYWQFSLYASVLMLVYGVLRHDLAICIGQLLVYAIYIRNLQLKGAWKDMDLWLRSLIALLPFVVLGWLTYREENLLPNLFANADIPVIWIWWGTVAQVFFTFRFVYQWMVSERKKTSELPLGFWIISATGSLMILAYGLYRTDPVLIAAHSVGIGLYARNIHIHFIASRKPTTEK